MMRIIAGIGKGRNLNSPVGAVRPTSDRAREAIFSTLESEFGSLQDLNFLDLYSGSGAVAAEALSRGAAFVQAVDKEERSTAIARSNLELLANLDGVGSSSVVTMSVARFLERPAQLPFDIIFLDPPYEFPVETVVENLNSLLTNGYLKASSIIAIERDSRSGAFPWPAGFLAWKERKYGAATIYYAAPA